MSTLYKSIVKSSQIQRATSDYLRAQLVKNLPVMQETPVQFLGQEDLLEKGKATQLQYSGLENPMNCMYSQWGPKSQTPLSNFHFHFQ